MTKTCREK